MRGGGPPLAPAVARLRAAGPWPVRRRELPATTATPGGQEIISYIPRCMAARTACTLAAMSGAPTSSETRAQQRAP